MQPPTASELVSCTGQVHLATTGGSSVCSDSSSSAWVQGTC